MYPRAPYRAALRLLTVAAITASSVLFPLFVRAEMATQLPPVNAFIDEVAIRDGFPVAALHALFDQVVLRPEIIEAITRPAEAKPWFEYRSLFLSPSRVEGGVAFWRANKEALALAEARYGVDPAVIVAILGVETRYGAKTGNYRVLEALTTLAFQYPRRAPFFREQLEAYLLLTHSEGIDPLLPKGSYAGAMGVPQFMPTSFRDFAVDFDGDGHRDLWSNPVDSIGSVANYLNRHGWQPHEPVAVSVDLGGMFDPAPLLGGLDQKPNLPLDKFRSLGLRPADAIAGNPMATLLRLDGPTSPEYWLCFENFYVITRYNHSPLYAMAVHELAREVAAGINNGKK